MKALPSLAAAIALSGCIVSATDFAEGNATTWGTFVPEGEGVAASVSDATNLVRAGNASVRFDTGSGFDTGVVFPKTPTAQWNLSTNTHLVFWSRGENTNDFQDFRPVVVLNGPGGSFRYEPDHNLTRNHQWTFIKVPLAGNVHWTRTAAGAPSLTNITQLEIHEDTWGSGFTMYYDGVEFVALPTNGPARGPAAPAGVNPDAVRQRVLLYIQDPIMENQGSRRMHEVYGWTDPVALTQRIIADFRTNSHGLYLPEIIETKVKDEYPWHLDGFQYDDASYAAAMSGGQWHDSGFDYWRFLTENNLASRIESGDVDEVWVYNFPGGGMWESTMAGEGGYWCNSGPVAGATNSRLAVVMGWNFERGVSEALESFGHRSESIMWKIYDGIWEHSRTNAWSAFTLINKDAPGLGAVGNVHYPVNGMSDYDWGNADFVWSTCDAWLNYPNLTNAPRLVDFHEWAGSDPDVSRRYLNWWYAHFPHVSGKAPAPDDRLNNWWRYLIDVEQFKAGNGTLPDASGLGSARITQPANGASVAGSVLITVDAGVDGALGRVDLYVDGAFFASDTLAPFRFVWPTGGLLGAHTLQARAYELQSGAETRSTPITVNVAGGTVAGTVKHNSLPLAGVDISATGKTSHWLRQTAAPAAAIPDATATGVTNHLTVSAAGALLDANVGVTVRHPRSSDLAISLVHPSGRSVALRAAGGAPGADVVTFYPELTAAAADLAQLAGLPIAGEWQLVCRDLTSGQTGQLESWSLALHYETPVAFGATSDASGAFQFTNLPAGHFTLRPAKPGLTFLPIVADLVVAADSQTVDFLVGPNDPPTILTPPTNQTVYAGNSVTFQVNAGGTSPLSYQWSFEGVPIAGATAPSLVCTNVLLGQSGIYRVVVSNAIPATISASAVLTVLPTPLPQDACEGSATNWLAFWPNWETTSATTTDSTEHVKTGSSSVRFDTGSGFDTGVKFPRSGDAHWDLRDVGWLTFWTYAENPASFQDPQPVVALNCSGGKLTLRPSDTLTQNHAWTFYRIPLAGDARWQRETNGAPSLADVNQIEIHQDTWGAGFTIWYDGLRFESKPWFESPMASTGVLQLTLRAPEGAECVLWRSTDLEYWIPVATNAAVDGRIDWPLPGLTPQQFFRATGP